MALRDLFRVRPVIAAATAVEPRSRDLLTSNDRSDAVWRVWREVGEVHYATTQQARLVSRLDWDVAINGNEIEPEQADAALEAVFGEYRDLARLGSLHLQVAGAYYLALTDDVWRVLPSPLSGKSRKLADESDILIRVINPDPCDDSKPDSPVRAALCVAQELILVRAQARATARNRTAQLGLLLYPREGAGADPDTFERRLQDVMTAPLQDETSSSVVVPNLVGFNGDLIDKWRHLSVSDGLDEKLTLKVEQLVRQLAVILDSPPELLLGMGDASHWSAWAISEDNFLGHIEPMSRIIGDGFAEALKQLSGGVDDIRLTPDPAALLRRRPTIADALSAYTAGVVSDEWLRKQLGADEDDAPDEPEPQPDSQPEVESSEAEPQTPVAAAAPVLDSRALAEIDRQLLDATTDLAETAIDAALTKLGAKARTALQGYTVEAARFADVSNRDLPARLGLARIPNLAATATDTVATVLGRWRRVADRAFDRTRSTGVGVSLADDVYESALATLSDGLAEAVETVVKGDSGVSETWAAVRRALVILGGGSDPEQTPTTAARKRMGIPSPLDGVGVATGRGAVQWVIDHRGLVPKYKWVHYGGAKTDHPKHVELHGREFDGESIVEDDVRWFPGDHAGCVCGHEVVWEAPEVNA